MRKLIAGLAIAGLVALSGCHNTSATGGGTQTGGTFKFEAPKTSTTVKHGSSETVEIKVDKKDFKEDVNLSVSVDPPNKGVTAEVSPKTLKASDVAKVDVKVSVDDKAPDGEYKVKVIGKPAKGAETDSIFGVKVPKKS
ncbi:MAG TPA: hypothetical protein VFE78_07560 [Gemmataceae bacterium]|jgi:uncharacterized membrane protein|nr:hypothetical protein [Gemmataceae bacterium]